MVTLKILHKYTCISIRVCIRGAKYRFCYNCVVSLCSVIEWIAKKSMAMNVLSTIALKLVACNVVNIVSLLLVSNYRYRFACFFDS